jgi:hypothetical protein
MTTTAAKVIADAPFGRAEMIQNSAAAPMAANGMRYTIAVQENRIQADRRLPRLLSRANDGASDSNLPHQGAHSRRRRTRMDLKRQVPLLRHGPGGFHTAKAARL